MNDSLAVIDGDPEEARPREALTLFGTADPIAVIGQASRVALALAKVIKAQELFTVIQGRSHVRVEGWTLLGSMLGVFPRVEWTRKLENGWEARAEAVVASTGMVIGAGEAQCLRSEKTWAGRDDYALRGMAQTRAVSRAMRGPLGFVVQLAGFATTPAEEMDTNEAGTAPPPLTTPANPSTASSPARTPTEIFSESRAKSGPKYADEDAVCPGCGRKEFLVSWKGNYFCSKRDGGCGNPPKGEVMHLIPYGQWRSK